MVHRFPLDREAGLLIAVHDALPLQTELLAHVTLPRDAVFAALAFPNEDGQHVLSHLELGHLFTHTLYHSSDHWYSNVSFTSNSQGSAVWRESGRSGSAPGCLVAKDSGEQIRLRLRNGIETENR